MSLIYYAKIHKPRFVRSDRIRELINSKKKKKKTDTISRKTTMGVVGFSRGC